MPQGKHSQLQSKLVAAINQIVEVQKVALAFPKLRCTFGGRSTVPNIAVFAWERIPLDSNGDVANGFTAAPDWRIEILSPDQNQTKGTSNILHCLKHGSRSGWLIDPEERSVLVYPLGQQPEFFEAADDRLPVPELAAKLQLTIGELFGWLKL